MKELKDIDVRRVLVILMGVIMARIVVGDLGIAGISFFGAVYMERRGRFPLFLAVLLGFITKLSPTHWVKYAMAMLVLSILEGIFNYYNKRLTIIWLSSLLGVTVSMLSIAEGIVNVNSGYFYLIAILEGIGVFALTLIFRKGVEPLLHGGKGQALNNEQVISLFILLAFLLYGLPSVGVFGISFRQTVLYLAILFVGYRFGVGYGALCGACCGIILVLKGGNMNEIGLMCMLGIIAGTFREFGRMITLLIYGLGAVLLGELYQNYSIEFYHIGALLSSGFLFLTLPKKLMEKGGTKGTPSFEEVFIEQNMQTIARGKLRDFSDSFLNLSQTFQVITNKKDSFTKEDKSEIFNELSEQLCKNCSNCNECWQNYFYETYQDATQILDMVEQNGTILLSEVPASFSKRCISLEYYLQEARRIVEIAKVNLFWHNKMMESRAVIAGQFSEVANIIDDFSLDLYKNIQISESEKQEFIFRMRNNHVIVNKVAVFEKRNGKQEIYVTCRMEKGKCITTKEAATVISGIRGGRFRPSDSCKNVVSKNMETFVFVEDGNYKVLTGVACAKKDGKDVSGDNYSFIYPDAGTAVMALSDGMGSGEEAYAESESVVELLERFIEAGFKKESAIKLINSILVLRGEEQSFSTIDMSVINLYTGWCDFIKMGASSTFVKKKEGVNVINSTTLPVGVIESMEYDSVGDTLIDGDFVIMVTDGVIDCIPYDEKEVYLAEFIQTIKAKNSRDIANLILNHCLELNGGVSKDDMTVLVSGFWEK